MKTRKVVKPVDTSIFKGVKFDVEDLEFAECKTEYEYVPVEMNKRDRRENVVKTLNEKERAKRIHIRKNKERFENKEIFEEEEKALNYYCAAQNTAKRRKEKKVDTIWSY